MPLVLAIDQSTSATKALFFDEQGNVVDQASREHRQHYPQPGWVEHDAEEIWQNVCAAARELTARQSARSEELLCVSVTNQRETIVVFARGTGRPLHPAIVWQCRRGDTFCAEQVRAGREQEVRRKTGLRIDSYFSASKLQWLVREHPDLRRKLQSGEALIGTIDTYLIYRFTGGTVFATDHTNASRTLLYDINRLGWDEGLCENWNVPRRALAEIRDCSGSYGETTIGGALPWALPIRGVIGDSQASLFAHRCFEPGAAKATFGTGCSVLLNVGHQPPKESKGAVATIAWVLDQKPTYAAEGIITASASTLTWLRDQLGLVASPQEAESLALAAGENGGVYLVPAFSGLGAPHWSETARAAIIGLSAHSDRRHVARAALESIAYQLRDVLEMLQSETGIALRGVQADGGATANRFLMQFTADIARVELRVANSPYYSPLGAAMLGLLGTGIHRSLDALAMLPRAETNYHPAMTADRATAHYAGWQRAVRQVLCSGGTADGFHQWVKS